MLVALTDNEELSEGLIMGATEFELRETLVVVMGVQEALAVILSVKETVAVALTCGR